MTAKHDTKSYLTLSFPNQKAQIGHLTIQQKMEWYAHQIQNSARVGQPAFHLLTPEFQRFWKWRVLLPLKMKRFFYRIKNGEVFKHYQHISEMKKSLKNGRAELI